VTDGDDLGARSRAIFERLRGEGHAEHGSDPDAEEPAVDPVEDGESPGEASTTFAPGGPAALSHDPPDVALDEAPEPAADAAAVASGPTPLPPGAGPVGTDGPRADGDEPVASDVAVPGPGVVPTDPPGEPDAAARLLPGGAELPDLIEATEPGAPADPGAEVHPEEPAGAVPASVFARPLPRVMAVANQKGGVGKTTTAVNLGACLADIGYRVLVVDLDPQGNASTGLGINIRDLSGSMYDVILHDMPIEDCVEATSVRNLFCAPSSLDLAGAEIELVPAFSREQRLKRALEEVRDDYDFVLIDCPPSLGLLTVNGLAAATEVVVPIQCEYYALEGLGQLLRNVNLVQKNLNPNLEVSAIVLVMYDARTKLADQVVGEVREHFGAKVCRNVIPRTVRLSEAPSFGQPIIAFDSSSRGAIAYRELAKEVSGGTPQRAG